MGELAEGVGPQLVRAGLVSGHRELDDDGQCLALELLDRIGHRRQTPHRGGCVGARGIVGRPLATTHRGGLLAAPPGRLDGAVDLGVRQSQPPGEPAGVLALERPVPDTGNDRSR